MDRGFTLIEVLVAVGIVALVAIGGAGLTMSSRSMAVNAAALQFDSLLDAARTTAREFTNGATIAFTPDAYGDGFVARLYQNRPGTAPLVATTIPELSARVSVREAEVLGTPAFALVIHGNGAIAGVIGNVLNGATTETTCPSSGAYHFLFSYGGRVMDRYLLCHVDLATTGPLTFATSSPAIPNPSPTPSCSGLPCASSPPASPNPTATCPPHYFASDASTCIDPPLVVTPNSLTFAAPGAPSQSVTAHEDLYRGIVTVETMAASGNVPGCSGSVIVAPTSAAMDSTYNAVFTIAPASQARRCAVSFHDDRGGTAQVLVGVVDPPSIVLVCNSDPRAGTTDNSTSQATQYIGTSASPPCGVQSTPPPSPTPPCAVDPNGNCVYSVTRSGGSVACIDSSGQLSRMWTGTVTYQIWIAAQSFGGPALMTVTDTVLDDGTGMCSAADNWSTGSPPATYYGDPNLPT